MAGASELRGPQDLSQALASPGMGRPRRTPKRDLTGPAGPGDVGLTHNPFAAALIGRTGKQARPENAAQDAAEDPPSVEASGRVRLRREVKGRGGHPVCRIEPDGALPPDLAKALASVLGCRVQVDGKDLIVGLRDPDRLVAALADRGYEVRRAN